MDQPPVGDGEGGPVKTLRAGQIRHVRDPWDPGYDHTYYVVGFSYMEEPDGTIVRRVRCLTLLQEVGHLPRVFHADLSSGLVLESEVLCP